MRILAIETSCDETAIAMVEASGGRTRPVFHVAANVVASQTAIHKKWGGVVPNLARRAHEKNLIPILHKALKDAGQPKLKGKNEKGKMGVKIINLINTLLQRETELREQIIRFLARYDKPDINVVAVTYGPGLEPALWVGINFAKALALAWGKPLVAVNHMEGHIVASLLKLKSKNKKGKTTEKKPVPRITFPAVALLVSGGHTELVLIKDWMEYKVLGATLDDAAGEAFDKVARMLELGYPGGPTISRIADGWKPQITNHKSPLDYARGKRGKQTYSKTHMIKFPRPMLHSRDLNFSFSGLKTAVLYYLQKQKRPFARTLVANVAASFQQAVVDVLVAKTLRAVKTYKPKTVLLGGGVAANEALRLQLADALSAQFPQTALLLPEKSFTGDNAAMIAAAAYFHAKKKAYANARTLRAEGGARL